MYDSINMLHAARSMCDVRGESLPEPLHIYTITVFER